MTEARLAREAEISYAVVGMATDYDCWRVGHEHVTNDEVVRTMKQNVAIAKAVVMGTIPRILAHTGELPCAHALKGAIMTAPEAVPDHVRADLAPIMGKYLGVPSSVIFHDRVVHQQEVAQHKLQHPHGNHGDQVSLESLSLALLLLAFNEELSSS
jgi:hypothetical protein